MAAPRNLTNERLYAAASTRNEHIPAERLRGPRLTFRRSMTVSVGESKLDVTQLISVDPGVKNDGD